MFVPRLRTAALAVAASFSLGACAYDGYGYSGVSVGYGGGYHDPYYDYGYYDGYYGYPSYYGWYGDYYYPGTGFYIYDRWGKRQRWSDRHRRYWENRRHHWRGDRRDNWGGYRDGPRAERPRYTRPDSNYTPRPPREARERNVVRRDVRRPRVERDRPRVQRERVRVQRERSRPSRTERRSRRD